MKQILAPISLGELIDKICILKIKSTKFSGVKLNNVNVELNALNKALERLNLDFDQNLEKELTKTNSELWEIEDKIRAKESIGSFDQEFINLARSVYQKNDQRADIKRRINTKYKSDLIEEKSYTEY